jgi:hypothetical protein
MTLQFQLTHKNNSQCVIINMYLSQIEYTIQKHECRFIFHLSNLHYINVGNFTCGHMHRAAYIFGRFAHGESRGKSRFEANLSIRALVPQNYRAGVRHAAVAAQATGRANRRWFGQTYQNRHRYLEIIARQTSCHTVAISSIHTLCMPSHHPLPHSHPCGYPSTVSVYRIYYLFKTRCMRLSRAKTST